MITALFMHGAGNEGAGFSWPKVEISKKPENVVGMRCLQAMVEQHS